MLDTKWLKFPLEVILMCIRWYAAYPLSYRHVEELMKERGISVDHSTVNRWAVRFLPLLEKLSRPFKRANVSVPSGGQRRPDSGFPVAHAP